MPVDMRVCIYTYILTDAVVNKMKGLEIRRETENMHFKTSSNLKNFRHMNTSLHPETRSTGGGGGRRRIRKLRKYEAEPRPFFAVY
jgi:hypothetical protein